MLFNNSWKSLHCGVLFFKFNGSTLMKLHQGTFDQKSSLALDL